MFQTKVVENIETHVSGSVTFIFFLKWYRLGGNVEKCDTAGQATYDNMVHTLYKLDTQGYKYTLRTCNTFCPSTTTMLARTLLNMTLYVHCSPCYDVLMKSRNLMGNVR